MTKLNIKNLSYRIGEKIILDNISFSCDSGEVIAIVGKNGVGKTTLLNNILENINKTENIQEQIKSKKISLVINNVQTTNKTIEGLITLAEKNKVPILNVTETQPDGKTYIEWMLDQYNKLEEILNGGSGEKAYHVEGAEEEHSHSHEGHSHSHEGHNHNDNDKDKKEDEKK